MFQQKISQMEWAATEALLATPEGKEMAKIPLNEDLPLHMACEKKAPDSTILRLLEIYSEASSYPGRSGGYPVHLAAQNQLPPTTIVPIIRAFPEALDQEDDSNNLPRDYKQGNNLSREALSRPTACWIEDVEKEEYMARVNKKCVQLRKKLATLQCALDISVKRRSRLAANIEMVEPKMQAQRAVLERLTVLEQKLDEVHKSNQEKVQGFNLRIKELSEDLDVVVSHEEDLKAKAILKRTYMQGVQRQYEKLVGRTDQVRKEIQHLKAARSP